MWFGKESKVKVMPGLHSRHKSLTGHFPFCLKKLSNALVVFLLAGILFGCAQEVTVDQKFVNLFVELRLAEMMYSKDSPSARTVRQDALKAAGYTREQFIAKTDEILNDERQWVPFQKAVNARIDSLLAIPPAPQKEGNAPEPKKRPPQAQPRKGGAQ